MLKRHKKMLLSMVVILLLVSLLILADVLKKPSVAMGRTIDVDERPAQWKSLIAKSVNEKGITLVVDGKTIQVDDNPLLMNDDMEIFIPESDISKNFNCAYGNFNNEKIQLQKGNTVAEAAIGNDKVKVGNENIDMVSPCILSNDTMYIQSQIFSKAFDYESKWDVNENTLYLNDVKYISSFLPNKYSLANSGRLSEVKDQGYLNICWATASISSIETSLLPKEKYKFSEKHMAYSNGNEATIAYGGEYTRSIAYLAAWLGPVTKETAFTFDGRVNTAAVAQKHLQEVQLIESKNYEAIKKAVFLYGGVQSSMYTSMTSSTDASVYYNRANASYCYIGTNKANHDVVIVGWDDNYPKSKFNIELEGDGAFICMNSWGPSFGNNGLFYVSYYDSSIGKNNVVYTSIQSPDNYDNIYQSDLAGWVGQLGYDNETAYFANVYTANGNENLEAVAFYATGKNTEYEVFFVDDFGGEASFGRKISVAKGKMSNAGYYTIELDKSHQLVGGKTYAIVVKITTPGAMFPIAVEHRAGVGTMDAILDDGEGYISLNGNSWEHVEETKECNICLKMFTNDR